MIRILTGAVVLSAMMGMAAEKCCSLSAPKEERMMSLFNGKDLIGWDGDTRFWSVKDGVIRGETTPEKKAPGNSFLICQKGIVGDFELRLSYRLSASNNSGIQYRSKRIDAPGKWIVRGYQHEIRNENKFPNVSGFIYSEGGLAGKGRLILCGEQGVRGKDDKLVKGEPLIDQAGYQKLFNLNGWNDVVIIAKGNNIRHYLNGKKILDFTDNSPKALKEGVIALQLHAGKPMWVEYKNVRMREL